MGNEDEYVTVAAFPSVRRTDAVMLKGRLEAEGVSCRLDSANANMGADLKVQVLTGQVLLARELIANHEAQATAQPQQGFVESLTSVFQKLLGRS